jgi:endonuclease/exonuclease/phosphatase (EEP) superfamily protein YafD
MRFINGLLLLAGVLILAALIGGHLNGLHPALDSLSHFRLHLAVIGVVLALVIGLMRNLLGAAALGVISTLSFATTAWPAFVPATSQAEAAPAAKYRLLQANLRFDNRSPEAFLRLVAETRPDVLTLQEVSDAWLPKLSAISAVYPHQLICPGSNRVGGVAILSRRAFVDDGLSFCANAGAFAVQAVDFNGAPIIVASVHLKWPWPHSQPQQLTAMAPRFGEINAAGQPVLIGGDMNAAPWSAAVSSIAQATGTRILPQARGTWLPPILPKSWTAFVGLPIDNVLSSEHIQLLQAYSGAAFGSDHRPIHAEFSVRPPREAATGNASS